MAKQIQAPRKYSSVVVPAARWVFTYRCDNDGFLPKISAFMLFIALWGVGRRLTRVGPNVFLVMNQVRQRKALHDPFKRYLFRFVPEHRP